MKANSKNNKRYRLNATCLFIAIILLGCDGESNTTAPDPTPLIQKQCLSGENWTYAAKGTVKSTAVTDSFDVYFGDSEGNAYSLNKITGELNWQVFLGGALDSKFSLINSILLIVSDKGQLHALNATDGSQIWQTELGDVSRSEYDYNIASPVVADEKVFVGKENGELSGFDLMTGQVKWQVNLQSPAHSLPVVRNGQICVSSKTDVSCSDIENEKLIWSKDIDWPSSPATDGQSVIVGSREDYAIYSFDFSTGEQIWKHDVVDWAPGEPIIDNGNIYIGTSDNYAFLSLSLNTGERQWRADTVANVFTKAAIHDESIIFSSGYAYNTPGFGVVGAVDFHGESLWSLPGCNFFSSAIVDGKSIYIGSDDGYLYSLDVNN
jgi:outer membrane protein assembly factor BamB